MIKRTLYFGNPAYLSLKNSQLVVKLPEVEKNDTLPESFKAESTRTIPIEDIGVVVLDNRQITITQAVLTALLENNAAVIQCNDTHHPVGLWLNLDGNSLQSQKFKAQIEASEPLKKQLWQQTIEAKIANQMSILKSVNKDTKRLEYLSRNVKSGDTDNCEAQAAAIYWNSVFSDYLPNFRRGREDAPPNNFLNYGYALLRAAVARALTSSGLLPTLGIFHRNQYNAYCLADDIMEPFRPFVDKIILSFLQNKENSSELNKTLKTKLLQIFIEDIIIDKERSPLMVGLSKTTASLSACFEGKLRKIKYPVFL
jgi:CRISPR-associated protein Cas1